MPRRSQQCSVFRRTRRGRAWRVGPMAPALAAAAFRLLVPQLGEGGRPVQSSAAQRLRNRSPDRDLGEEDAGILNADAEVKVHSAVRLYAMPSRLSSVSWNCVLVSTSVTAGLNLRKRKA